MQALLNCTIWAWDLMHAIEYRGCVFYVINCERRIKVFLREAYESVRTFSWNRDSDTIPLLPNISPPKKIGLGIEIMCLRAVRYRSDGRYRFNSITCFFFIVESALTAHMLLLAAFGPIFSSACPTLYARITQWPGRTRGRESFLFYYVSRVTAVLARPSDRRGPMSYTTSCMLEEREKFSKAMTSLFERCDVMRSRYLTRANRTMCLLHRRR